MRPSLKKQPVFPEPLPSLSCLGALATCLALWASTASAAPDDRGAKGAVFSLGGGVYYADATGLEGEALAPSMGGAYSLGIREEVWPRLMLGLNIAGYVGGTEDFESFSLNGLLLEARWRLDEGLRGPVLMGGLGIGGGGLSGGQAGEEDVSGGGALWRVAIGYELVGEQVGWSVTPSLAYENLRAQMDSKVSLSVFSLSLELAWELGR